MGTDVGMWLWRRWLWKPKFREPPLVPAPISPHSRTDDMRMSLTIGDLSVSGTLPHDNLNTAPFVHDNNQNSPMHQNLRIAHSKKAVTVSSGRLFFWLFLSSCGCDEVSARSNHRAQPKGQ